MSEKVDVTGTMETFGHPSTLIREYEWWSVLLRPQQPTLGSMVLAAKSSAASFGELGEAACAELSIVTADIERVLSAFVQNQKINYLMLMMKDPDVHFHVIPRYEGAREFDGVQFVDVGWPGQPDLGACADLTEAQCANLVSTVKAQFNAR